MPAQLASSLSLVAVATTATAQFGGFPSSGSWGSSSRGFSSSSRSPFSSSRSPFASSSWGSIPFGSSSWGNTGFGSSSWSGRNTFPTSTSTPPAVVDPVPVPVPNVVFEVPTAASAAVVATPAKTTPPASATDWDTIMADPEWWKTYVQPQATTPDVVVEAPMPVENWWEVPVVSPSSYPAEWATANTPTAAPAKEWAANHMYDHLGLTESAFEKTSNMLYQQMESGDPSKADIEARYGKQMSTNSVYMNPGKPKGMPKDGPAIYAGGQFRRTEPSIVNGPLTGRPVVAYDFHGVIQNCPAPRAPCTVMTSIVDQLIEDSKNNDIIIVTAGVPEGNQEIVDYLKEQAGIWHLIKHLYNSGSKWEVMADLNVIRHYDDLKDNLRRINSRITGMALVHVEPSTERMTVYIA